jgi:hypothetical protein
MSEFSATDAGLVGFKILREKPMVWPAWAIASLAISIVTVILLVVLTGPALAEVQEISKSATPDPEALMSAYGRVGPAMLLLLPVSLIFYGVLYAAASRIVLRPADQGFGWLKFGADEWRQALALLAVFGILLVAYIAVIIVAVLLGALSSLVSPILGGLVGVLAALAAIGGLVYIGVRLSLVSPATFATGRIDIGAAWRLTKGRFAPMFGAYVLAVILALIITAVGTGAFFLIGMLVFGLADTSKAVFSPDMSSMATMFPPVGIAYYIWSALISGLTLVITATVAPTIYKQITGGEPAVFD